MSKCKGKDIQADGTEINCTRYAVYGEPDIRKAIFCKFHKSDRHIDCKSARCKKCPSYAIFGLVGTKKAEYCSIHKPDDSNYINVKNRSCLGCGKTALFGLPGSYAQYCSLCKPNDNYIDVHSKMCIICKVVQARFGSPITRKAEYCTSCKPEGYINLGR